MESLGFRVGVGLRVGVGFEVDLINHLFTLGIRLWGL